MQFRLHLGAVALVAVMAAGALSSAVAADGDSRSIIMGRQQIREELARAMEDGRLTRMEQYSILLHAKEKLPPQDLDGLQATLDRLANSGRMAGYQGRIRPGAASEGGALGVLTSDDHNVAKQMKYEEVGGETSEPTPFQEETPGGAMPSYGNEGYAPGCEGGRCFSGPMLDDDEDVCMPACRPWNAFSTIKAFSTVDAFKGPLDLADLNGNFGVRFGVNGAVPVAPRMGLGLQGGISAVLSDFHGTTFTDNRSRTQEFVTVGLFQRIPTRKGGILSWGFAYDWLMDDYYALFRFGQWRTKLSYQFNPANEVGIWAAIKDHGDSGILVQGDALLPVSFRPISQGSVYYRHSWFYDIETTGWFGVAEEPGSFVFGADSRVPMGNHLALIGGFNYILPSARGGFQGQSEEMWNVSVGIEFCPGGGNHCPPSRFSPLFPVADNGSFAIKQR